MPRALAIETSGRVGSIALVDGNEVIAEAQFAHGLKHAAEVVPMIDRVCRARGWTARDLEHLYVSVGPGSFTGLRIGVTLAKTLAFATGVKLVAVPTVRVLVENAPAEAAHVIIVLDAKREQVFTARFERAAGEWAEREQAHLDSLAAMIARSPKPVHLLGEGIPFHLKFVANDGSVVLADDAAWRARAAVVAQIGLAMAGRGEFADPFRLTPTYIRLPEAEERRQAEEAAAKLVT